MSFNGQWKRYGCCPNNQAELPAPSQNIAIFELTGYNYRAIPEWFDSSGQKMIPLQFSVLYDQLYYRWTFYKKANDQCGKNFVYHLSTSDDIFPTIVDGVTGKKLDVKRVARHNGYTNWRVEC